MTILQIQCLLAYLGYYTILVDGIWGEKSAEATKKFQEDFGGLAVSGSPDEDTQKALTHAVAYGMTKKPDTSASSGSQTTSFWDDIKYFTRAEFKCKCGGKYCNGFPAEPKEGMVRAIDKVREHFGKAFSPNSAVRCPTHNANVGGVYNSRHLTGGAVDFAVPGKTASQVLAYVKTLSDIVYAYDIDGTSVHMDIGS